MSETENFAARWSRLKRETAKPAGRGPARLRAPAAPPAEAAAPPLAREAPQPAEAPRVDLASLPPIESITAASDIRQFLQAGVSAELTRAALRRAWSADPAIRDFIGLAENQWDFTDPTAMHGFGPLEATDDVEQLVSQAMGRWRAAAEPMPEEPAAVPPVVAVAHASEASQVNPADAVQAPGMPAGIVAVAESAAQQNEVNAASQQQAPLAEGGPASNRRVHGSALPQ